MGEEKNKVITSITLMDGTVLPCEPLGEGEKPVPTRWALNHETGEYYYKPHPKFRSDETEEEIDEIRRIGWELWLEHAFLIYRHREEILRDSKMFLTPLMTQCGLAYTGSSGFERPTVGIYLEWWATCPLATHVDEEGVLWLVTDFGGIPLSGTNRTTFVSEDGRRDMRPVHDFTALWSSYQEVNVRYNRAKRYCRSYNFFELVKLLEEK